MKPVSLDFLQFIFLQRAIHWYQAYSLTVMKLAGLIAAPLEGMSLWILSWSLHGSKNLTGLSDWLWSLAFVIHIPGNIAVALWGGSNRVYYWPALFVSGFVEFWLLVAAVVWGWRTAQGIISTHP